MAFPLKGPAGQRRCGDLSLGPVPGGACESSSDLTITSATLSKLSLSFASFFSSVKAIRRGSKMGGLLSSGKDREH